MDAAGPDGEGAGRAGVFGEEVDGVEDLLDAVPVGSGVLPDRTRSGLRAKRWVTRSLRGSGAVVRRAGRQGRPRRGLAATCSCSALTCRVGTPVLARASVIGVAVHAQDLAVVRTTGQSILPGPPLPAGSQCGVVEVTVDGECRTPGRTARGDVMAANESSAPGLSPKTEARAELQWAIGAQTRSLGRYSGQHHRAPVDRAHAYAPVTGGSGAPATSGPEQRL